MKVKYLKIGILAIIVVIVGGLAMFNFLQSAQSAKVQSDQFSVKDTHGTIYGTIYRPTQKTS